MKWRFFILLVISDLIKAVYLLVTQTVDQKSCAVERVVQDVTMTGPERKAILLVLIIGWIYVLVTLAENPQWCVFTVEDTYKKYHCVKTMAGSLPLMACSLRCCDEHRCIGIFHKKDQTDNCYLISATEEDTGCADFDWAIWTAYKKRKDLGQCGSLLMDTVGYYHLADSSKVAAETSRLNYVPNSINEIGGFLYDTVYLLVKLSSAAKVRGTVIQGRWRDEALALCCDERVTEYFINYSPDCDSSWVFYPASNTGTIYFEGHVIPGAGNEAVVNLFDEPVVGICFAFYVQSYHLQPIVRWDLIGCEI